MRRASLAWGAWAAAFATALAARSADARSPAASAEAAIRVEPRSIEVGMFYRGTVVRVEGAAPAGFRLALVCVGPEGKVELRRKGKVWNLLWMNVGGVTFERVPSVYLASVDPEEAGAEGLSELRLGPRYDGVEAQVLPADAEEGTRNLFREFIRLREQERLYSYTVLRREVPSEEGATPGGAVLVGLGRPVLPARAWTELELPASAPPGAYEIRMIGFRDGAGEILASERLTVARVGLARLVASMAQSHGLVYGILSVAAAVAAGLLSGVLFTGAKKGH
jgi:hypothetical protein